MCRTRQWRGGRPIGRRVNTLYLVLLGISALIALGLVAGLYSSRLGFSHLLVFLVVGMLAGVDGPLGLPFSDHRLAFGVGNVALAMILLDGGLRTPWGSVRAGLVPASLLASFGVVVTSLVTAAVAVAALDMDWRHGLLLGAVVSSTDAAAVFNQMRSSGVRLPQRLAATVEVESGLNDPIAVFLTLSLIAVYTQGGGGAGELLTLAARQAGWGILLGLGGAGLAAAVLRRLPLDKDHEGLSALLLTTAGMMVFAVAGLLDGSGFLAIYLFGLLTARRARAVVAPALPAINGYTWIAQALLFLLLGLLVTPHQLLWQAGPALVLTAALMLVARPLAVALCLTPLRFGWREQALVGWIGLRGAVPIVLALYPVIAGVPGALKLFNVAFVVVLVSLLVQGPSLGWLARRLRLPDGAPASPAAPSDTPAV